MSPRRSASYSTGAWTSVALVVGLTACNGGPTAPLQSGQDFPRPTAPAPPPPPGPPFIVSGFAVEHRPEGPRTLEGLRLQMTGTTIPDVTTDATGYYQFSEVPSGPFVIEPSPTTGYYAPCPTGQDNLTGHASRQNVHVASGAVLSTTGVPASLFETLSTAQRLHSVEGVVFERAPGGDHPVDGATVELAPHETSGAAMSTSRTDAAGRYLLCTAPPGLGSEHLEYVRARQDGYRPAATPVIIGWGERADVELVRR